MEKGTAHWKLALIHSLVRQDKVRLTEVAYRGARMLGMNRAVIMKVILGLRPTDFYKSMTTHANHKIWQDVYLPLTSAGPVYLKFTIMQDLLVVSFRER